MSHYVISSGNHKIRNNGGQNEIKKLHKTCHEADKKSRQKNAETKPGPGLQFCSANLTRDMRVSMCKYYN